MTTNQPIPSNENERLEALKGYNLLDTLDEKEFDRLTELASIICDVPIALVSLVDKDRQWFKSKVGLEATETPRDISFCQYAIMGRDIFEVTDATKDERFKNNPLVEGNPEIRFYAGYPLLDQDGFALGTLCVIDRKSKKLNANQEIALKILSQEVVSHIQHRKERSKLNDYFNLFQSSIDLVCIASADGFFKKVNPAFKTVLGWSESDLLSKPFTDYIHPDDLEKTFKEVEKLSKGFNTINFVNRYRKKSGEYIYLSWTSNPDPTTGNLYAIARDITEKVLNDAREKDYIKEIEHLKYAIDNTAIVAITDPKGTIIRVNDKFTEISGYSRNELIGSTHKIVNSGFHDKQFIADLWKTILSGNIWKGNIKNKAKTGQFYWVNTTIVPRKDESGKIIEFIAIRQDVTNAINQNEELKARETEINNHLRAINTSNAAIEFDLDGIILNVNPNFCEIIGYTEKELIGQPHSILLEKEYALSDNYKEFWRDLRKGSFMRGEFKRIHKSGKELWILGNYNPIFDVNGRPYKILKIATDITSRLETENELKKAKLVAEKSVFAKDQFLANMSHEIRTPMNAILGFTDILLTTDLNNNQKEYLKAISNSGENLMVIINDILDFSKIESGNLTLEKSSFDLHSLLNNCKKLLSHKAKEHNLEFNFYIDNETPKFIIGDSVRLNQILINLLGNAIKFTEHGKVELYCKPLHFEDNQCKIIFTVKDTGIGIPEKKQDIIFERFKPAEENTTRKFGGTGLGLSITKKLILLFGGELRLKSELGKGSEFIVEIPFIISNEVQEEEIIEAPLKNTSKTFRVLLTEDNELNQKLAKHILESSNFVVDIVSNGQLAIDALKINTYDVILMDLQMPVMDGYVATAFIRNVMKISTPMIAMTAHSLIGEKEKCLQIGMNDYISKPYKAKELISKINKLFTNNEDVINLDSKVITAEDLKVYALDEVIDLSNNDQNFVREMIKIFIRDVPAEVAKFSNLISDNNTNEIKHIAHKIKSSYSIFMAHNCVEYCSKIEEEQNLEAIKELTSLLIKNTNLISEGLKKEIL